eukprot:TRINITY_DN2833_c0_g1_i1.p1 TRINITY_DN2833_c0_g1~~TRINITY_DN2833_c0_g1_i1.p1  ORF type:complete len:125 (+),score=30.85 TRINITY_DN2833_c0_g1_i1:44-418(+)
MTDIPKDKLVYKLLVEPDWSNFQKSGSFKGSAVDLSDGFIHLSTAGQSKRTADLYYAQKDSILLEVDLDRVKPETVKWEFAKSRQQYFPHIYGELPLSAVTQSAELPWSEGGHKFPEWFHPTDV